MILDELARTNFVRDGALIQRTSYGNLYKRFHRMRKQGRNVEKNFRSCLVRIGMCTGVMTNGTHMYDHFLMLTALHTKGKLGTTRRNYLRMPYSEVPYR